MTIRNTILLTILISLYSSVPIVHATVEGAIKSVEKGDYASALQEFKRLAEKGNPSAQNNLAYLYAKGLGVPTDPEKALYWFKQASLKGNSEAKDNIKFLLKTYPNLAEKQINLSNNLQNVATTSTESPKSEVNLNINSDSSTASSENKNKIKIEIASIANSTQDIQTNKNKRVVTGDIFEYSLKKGENTAVLSARFGIDKKHLGKTKAGDSVQINNRHIIPHLDEIEKQEYKVVVNLAQRMLFYRTKDGTIEGRPVGVGKTTTQTPTKLVSIVEKRKNPAWNVPPSISKSEERKVVPPGPHNPLGKFWLGLSASGYGIHGTNVPNSIYSRASHGCIRMNNEHVLQLASQVSVGDQVRIIYEPVLFTVSADNEILMEVHEDGYSRKGNLYNEAIKVANSMGLTKFIDWEVVKKEIKEKDGFAIVVGRKGQQVNNNNDVVSSTTRSTKSGS